MGNDLTAWNSSGPDRLALSNGGTDVFFDVLTLRRTSTSAWSTWP